MAAGETVYWKIKLAKGQMLRVKAIVDVSQIETDPSSDLRARPRRPRLHLDIFTPLREPLSEENGGTTRRVDATSRATTPA